MKELIIDSGKFYYSDLILVAVTLYSTIFIYKNTNRAVDFHLLYLYPLSSFLNSIFNYYIIYINHSISESNLEFYITISNLIFTIIEFSLLSLCILHFTTIRYFKRLNISTQLLYFIIIMIINLTQRSEIVLQDLYILNFIFISFNGILGLIDIFRTHIFVTLTDLKLFWILSGVFVYFLGTIPIFLSSKLIFQENFKISEEKLYSFNYLAYIILFSSLVISTKCNTIKNQ